MSHLHINLTGQTLTRAQNTLFVLVPYNGLFVTSADRIQFQAAFPFCQVALPYWPLARKFRPEKAPCHEIPPTTDEQLTRLVLFCWLGNIRSQPRNFTKIRVALSCLGERIISLAQIMARNRPSAFLDWRRLLGTGPVFPGNAAHL